MPEKEETILPTPQEDEVVIAGISGTYPLSANIEELKYNLFNKINMVQLIEKEYPEVPPYLGKLPNIQMFDSNFFNIPDVEAVGCDPGARMLMEKVFEAILDAGMHPDDLYGTSTGVFSGASFSESDSSWFFGGIDSKHGFLGTSKFMLANRISHWLNLTGPSYNVDTACSSSLYATEHAYHAVRTNVCEYAIVLTSNLCLSDTVTLQFLRLGVVSPKNFCKTFDESGDGYVRSETVAAFLLTKSKYALRKYADVVHAKTNCDGFKSQGITYPSGLKQKQLLNEFYSECSVKPNELAYLECHGTGTLVGDYEEGHTIDDVFCKDRGTPLPVGSVKSNLGHSEAGSGLCSLTKVLLAFENDTIPPNLHFTSPRKDVPGLIEGRFFIVTENTKLEGDYIGVNGFGFGGANCHILLRRNTKTKINSGIPDDDLPRIVVFSGRTMEAIDTIRDDFASRTMDAEYIRLYHNIFRKNINRHYYRSYLLLQKNEPRILKTEHTYINYIKRSTVYIINGIDSTHIHINGTSIFNLPLFAERINQLNAKLAPFNLNLMQLAQKNVSNSSLHSAMEFAAMQIMLIDTLKKLDIKPDNVIGYSNSEFLCAYTSGILTDVEVILGVYYTKVQGSTNIKTASIATEKQNGSLPNGKPANVCSSNVMSQKGQLSPTEIKKFIINIKQKLQNSQLMTNKFIEQVQKIERNSVIVVISPDSLFMNMLNKLLPKYINVSCFVTNGDSNIKNFMSELGKLYLYGLNPQYHELYPKIQFPVSRGTPMISSLIKWNRHTKYRDFRFHVLRSITENENYFYINIKTPDYSLLTGHIIDGRNLFPATGYIYIVWESYQKIQNKLGNPSVVFENLRFCRATNLSDIQIVFTVLINPINGYFEITEGGSLVVSGTIRALSSKDTFIDVPKKEPVVTEELLPLTTPDVYKELRLRGYNYQKKFRGIVWVDNSRSVAEIKWDGEKLHYITYIDSMMQLKILKEPGRFLYVPTSIKRLIIDPVKQFESMKDYSETEKTVTVTNYDDYNVIQGGGVEIHGLNATLVNRRKPLGEAVLEKQIFVPYINRQELDVSEALRILFQLGIENNPIIKVKIVELDRENSFLAEHILNVLNDLPLIQTEIALLTKVQVDDLPKNIVLSDKRLDQESNAIFVIAFNLLQNSEEFETANKILKNEKGYIISRENLDSPTTVNENFDIICEVTTNDERLVMLRKKVPIESKPIVIKISDETEFPWLEELKSNLTKNEPTVVYSQNDYKSGIVGFVNCLVREPSGTQVQGVFIDDITAPDFDIENPFYKEQLDKKLRINIYKNGAWGCFRHMKITETTINSENSYLNLATRGDLSSFKWYELPLSKDEKKLVVDVYFAALNFRDVMTATGKLGIDFIVRNALPNDTLPPDVVQGLEFSGRDKDGNRYMGLVGRGGLANRVEADKQFLWPVPENWTMEDAATVPVVYATVFYALAPHNINSKHSILIHAGSGGIGLAAINIALHYGCQIFTTVGTEEKRDFIKQNFPQINDNHIGNSRDTTFEQLIMEETNGRGVDFILNSLADDKLIASLRCLAEHGTFLEIGKFDMANDTNLGMEVFLRGASFHSIMLDNVIFASESIKQGVFNLVGYGIKSGAIKPLPRHIFRYDDPEKPFRFMAAGKHYGKILLKIREEESELLTKPSRLCIESIPRFYSDRSMSMVIIGGLGGFGLELSNWCVERGCKNLILSSRQGLQKGYQCIRIQKWTSAGINVVISTADISTREGCIEILQLANKHGSVEAIYNLAVVLKDALIENQTVENFQTSFKGKANATYHLDEVSRTLCPQLKYFVVFSSVSCGRGNAGQTNYGMANSVMERICEKRKADGYPSLAIQWGAIGEVGLVADMQDNDKLLEIGGTLQQNLKSCFESLDILLRQDETVVSSMVVAAKKYGFGAGGSLVDTILNILGVKDVKTIGLHTPLVELGMDSMMGVEIKQTLEREFEVFLTAQDIRDLTLAKLIEIQNTYSSDANEEYMKMLETADGVFKMLVNTIGEESNIITEPLIEIEDSSGNESYPPMFLFPGIEGQCSVFKSMYSGLRRKVYGVHFYAQDSLETVQNWRDYILPGIQAKLKPNSEFYFVAHSFGALIATEIGAQLEKEGYTGKYFFIDGSSHFMKLLTSTILGSSDNLTPAAYEAKILTHCTSFFGSKENKMSLKNTLESFPNLNARIDFIISKVPEDMAKHSTDYLRKNLVGLLQKFRAITDYEIPEDLKLNGTIMLVLPTSPLLSDVEEKYDLALITDEEKITIETLEGDHLSILNNPSLPDTIKKYFLL